MQTIFPILRYTDARAAIRWLEAAFGFKERFSVPETGDFVRHAQLGLGTNLIMIGSVRDDDGLKSPQTLGVATQAIAVYVPDVDEHFERARLAGAAIIAPPEDTDFGTREYHARDPEGHIWAFGTYLPGGEES
ncbi:MAG: VOC family protein [Acidobacteriota bacterium]